MLRHLAHLVLGPADAKIAIVSRSPGYHESMSGRPFSGMSGKVLDYLLKEQGVDRKNVLATNVVLCHTDSQPEKQLKLVLLVFPANLEGRSIIIAAGTEAITAILGRQTVSVVAATSIEIKSGARIIATSNPAVVLRDDQQLPSLQRDFRLAINPLPSSEAPTGKVD